MKLVAFEAVAKVLAQEQVRYLVAGGLAVNAHGYVRLTMDIDIIIALDSDNIRSTFRALSELGYQPTVPIDTEDFARPEQRERWREEKGMQVLNLQSDRFPGTSVDIFVYEPFDFASEYDAALIGELLPELPVMSKQKQPVDWRKTTFEGSRREQLRCVQSMTVRQRLEAMSDLAELTERLQTMPRRSGRRADAD